VFVGGITCAVRALCLTSGDVGTESFAYFWVCGEAPGNFRAIRVSAIVLPEIPEWDTHKQFCKIIFACIYFFRMI